MSISKLRLVRIITAYLALLGGVAYAQSLPSGAQVRAGQLGVNTLAGQMTVNQFSDKAIIDWRDFSVGQGHSVTFVQPGANSIVLNRSLGGTPSNILGNLSANGQVFVVNPSGVIFGVDSVVDVAGLVATTLDIGNDDFLAGKFVFSRDASDAVQAVRNLGVLRARQAGYVVLAGDEVSNDGVVQATLGTSLLASGQALTLDVVGDKLISYAIDPHALTRAAGVSNVGSLFADGGRAVMSAGTASDLASLVVNNSGVVRAQSVANHQGEIVLSAAGAQAEVSGTLDVSSTQAEGGTIQVLGDAVNLKAGAWLDARGARGGGQVLVGGAWQGGKGLDDAPPQAQRTTMQAGASIDASATESGDGGTVVLWSDVNNTDGRTTVAGSIHAQGGAWAGDGGRVETSGHWLGVDGLSVSTLASHGAAGQWLLDPYNVVIGDTGGTPSAGENDYANATTISSLALANALNTNDVSIVATGDGQIVVNRSIQKTSSTPTTLTLDANRILLGATALVADQATFAISGDQLGLSLRGPVLARRNVDLATRGGAIQLDSTLDGFWDVQLNAGAGRVDLGGAVGSTQRLYSLTVSAGDAIHVGGDVITMGTQTYNGDLWLDANATFLSDGLAASTTSLFQDTALWYGDATLTLVGGKGGDGGRDSKAGGSGALGQEISVSFRSFTGTKLEIERGADGTKGLDRADGTGGGAGAASALGYGGGRGANAGGKGTSGAGGGGGAATTVTLRHAVSDQVLDVLVAGGGGGGGGGSRARSGGGGKDFSLAQVAQLVFGQDSTLSGQALVDALRAVGWGTAGQAAEDRGGSKDGGGPGGGGGGLLGGPAGGVGGLHGGERAGSGGFAGASSISFTPGSGNLALASAPTPAVTSQNPSGVTLRYNAIRSGITVNGGVHAAGRDVAFLANRNGVANDGIVDLGGNGRINLAASRQAITAQSLGVRTAGSFTVDSGVDISGFAADVGAALTINARRPLTITLLGRQWLGIRDAIRPALESDYQWMQADHQNAGQIAGITLAGDLTINTPDNLAFAQDAAADAPRNASLQIDAPINLGSSGNLLLRPGAGGVNQSVPDSDGPVGGITARTLLVTYERADAVSGESLNTRNALAPVELLNAQNKVTTLAADVVGSFTYSGVSNVGGTGGTHVGTVGGVVGVTTRADQKVLAATYGQLQDDGTVGPADDSLDPNADGVVQRTPAAYNDNLLSIRVQKGLRLDQPVQALNAQSVGDGVISLGVGEGSLTAYDGYVQQAGFLNLIGGDSGTVSLDTQVPLLSLSGGRRMVVDNGGYDGTLLVLGIGGGSTGASSGGFTGNDQISGSDYAQALSLAAEGSAVGDVFLNTGGPMQVVAINSKGEYLGLRSKARLEEEVRNGETLQPEEALTIFGDAVTANNAKILLQEGHGNVRLGINSSKTHADGLGEDIVANYSEYLFKRFTNPVATFYIGNQPLAMQSALRNLDTKAYNLFKYPLNVDCPTANAHIQCGDIVIGADGPMSLGFRSLWAGTLGDINAIDAGSLYNLALAGDSVTLDGFSLIGDQLLLYADKLVMNGIAGEVLDSGEEVGNYFHRPVPNTDPVFENDLTVVLRSQRVGTRNLGVHHLSLDTTVVDGGGLGADSRYHYPKSLVTKLPDGSTIYLGGTEERPYTGQWYTDVAPLTVAGLGSRSLKFSAQSGVNFSLPPGSSNDNTGTSGRFKWQGCQDVVECAGGQQDAADAAIDDAAQGADAGNSGGAAPTPTIECADCPPAPPSEDTTADQAADVSVAIGDDGNTGGVDQAAQSQDSASAGADDDVGGLALATDSGGGDAGGADGAGDGLADASDGGGGDAGGADGAGDGLADASDGGGGDAGGADGAGDGLADASDGGGGDAGGADGAGDGLADASDGGGGDAGGADGAGDGLADANDGGGGDAGGADGAGDGLADASDGGGGDAGGDAVALAGTSNGAGSAEDANNGLASSVALAGGDTGGDEVALAGTSDGAGSAEDANNGLASSVALAGGDTGGDAVALAGTSDGAGSAEDANNGLASSVALAGGDTGGDEVALAGTSDGAGSAEDANNGLASSVALAGGDTGGGAVSLAGTSDGAGSTEDNNDGLASSLALAGGDTGGNALALAGASDGAGSTEDNNDGLASSVALAGGDTGGDAVSLAGTSDGGGSAEDANNGLASSAVLAGGDTGGDALALAGASDGAGSTEENNNGLASSVALAGGDTGGDALALAGASDGAGSTEDNNNGLASSVALAGGDTGADALALAGASDGAGSTEDNNNGLASSVALAGGQLSGQSPQLADADEGRRSESDDTFGLSVAIEQSGGEATSFALADQGDGTGAGRNQGAGTIPGVAVGHHASDQHGSAQAQALRGGRQSGQVDTHVAGDAQALRATGAAGAADQAHGGAGANWAGDEQVDRVAGVSSAAGAGSGAAPGADADTAEQTRIDLSCSAVLTSIRPPRDVLDQPNRGNTLIGIEDDGMRLDDPCVRQTAFIAPRY